MLLCICCVAYHTWLRFESIYIYILEYEYSAVLGIWNIWICDMEFMRWNNIVSPILVYGGKQVCASIRKLVCYLLSAVIHLRYHQLVHTCENSFDIINRILIFRYNTRWILNKYMFIKFLIIFPTLYPPFLSTHWQNSLSFAHMRRK